MRRCPAANQRVTPATARRVSRRSCRPTPAAALRTAPGAHHWRCHVPRVSVDEGRLRRHHPARRRVAARRSQLCAGARTRSSLDRVYVHGDPLYGQKRGIALNARTVTIRNSYISEIKAVGADAQAIGGWNGPGPFSIENNYLEASGEVFLLGGADPADRRTWSARTCSVRYNYMSRPMSWRDPIVATPSGVTASAPRRRLAGGGRRTPTASSRGARRGRARPATSLPSPESRPSRRRERRRHGRVDAGAGCDRVPGLRAHARRRSQFWTVTGTSFTDTGAAGKARRARRRRHAVAGEEHLRAEERAARARRIQPVREQLAGARSRATRSCSRRATRTARCPWCVVEAGGLHPQHRAQRGRAASTSWATTPTIRSQQTNGIRIVRTTCFYGVTTELGGNGWAHPHRRRAARHRHRSQHVRFRRDDGAAMRTAAPTVAPRTIAGFRFTNNAAPHGTYGINGADASTGTLDAADVLSRCDRCTGNWLSGGNPRRSTRRATGSTTPFKLDLTSAAASRRATGPARISRGCCRCSQAIPKGLMIGVPQSPRNLRIISSGK